MNKRPSFLILALLWLLATACTSAATPIRQLEQAEQQWTEQSINHYRLELLVVRSIWHAQTHYITVRDNQVIETEASCVPAPMEFGECEVEVYAAESYTIPALFDFARSELQGQNAQWLNVTYDPTYGYPSHISYNHPEILDEDWSWQVRSFERLE